MRISVIVPILNPGVYGITRMIKSFISQDYEDKELIIIDGGSTDGTIDVLKKYEDHISYWISEPDGSVFEAFNKGIREATGDFVGFCGGTDYYAFDALQAAADAYEKNGGDVLYGDFLMEQDDGGLLYVKSPRNRLERLMYAAPFGYMGTFMRPNDLIEVWKNFEGTLGDDTFFFSKQFRSGKQFTRIDSRSWLQALSYGGIEYEHRYRWAVEDRKASYKALEDSPELTSLYSEEIEKTFSRRIYELWEEIFSPEEINAIMRDILPSDKTYILFGTGMFGKVTTLALVECDCNIKYYVDNSKEKQKERFYTKKICSPDALLTEKNCTVVISSYEYNDEIRGQLEAMPLDESVEIISYIDIPYYLYKKFGDRPLEEAYNAGTIK